MICASVYLLVFIRNLLVHLAEKILLMQPLTFGGDYHYNEDRPHSAIGYNVPIDMHYPDGVTSPSS
jgi:transposase InsO family protein